MGSVLENALSKKHVFKCERFRVAFLYHRFKMAYDCIIL